MPTRHKRENENKNNKTICTLHTIQHMAETRKVHPVGAVLLIINLLMASRISLSRSILLLQRTNNHFPYSHFTPKRFPKSYPCPLWSSSFSLCLQTLHKSSTTTATTPPSISNCCSSISMDPVVDEANPLLQDFEFPPFDVVEAKHVRPGIRALLKNLVCSCLYMFLLLTFSFLGLL